MTNKFEDNLNAAMETSKRIIDEHNVAEQKRQEEERLKKEQVKWENGVVAESVKQFEEFLKKGYKPTYESCGGAKLSSKNGVNILKLACQYGLESEEATKLFVQSKDPEIMEILVKEGKADVCKYPMKKIREWYDTPDTVTTGKEPIYREVRNPDYWNKGGNGFNEVYDGDRGWEPHYILEITGYTETRHVKKNNKGAMPAFKKLVELGYKPETPEDAKAFEYMAEKLQKIIEKEKIIAEEKAKYEAEQKRRDAEIEKIGDCPLGQKLLASALIKAGVMKDSSQIDSLYDVLTTDSQRKEFKRLQQEGIISEKFEVLKPWEFSNSKFFTGSMYDDMRPYMSTSDIKDIPSVKEFMDETEKQHEAELKAQKAKEEAKELAEVEKCPPAIRLLGKALMEKGLNHYALSDWEWENKTVALYEFYKDPNCGAKFGDKFMYSTEQYIFECVAKELKKLRKDKVLSKELDILKPEEFINSRIFADASDIGFYFEYLDLRETETVKEYMQSVKQEREQKLKELNTTKLAKLRNKVAKFTDKVAEATGTEKVVKKLTGGKKIEEVEISSKIKSVEKAVSDRLFGKVKE